MLNKLIFRENDFSALSKKIMKKQFLEIINNIQIERRFETTQKEIFIHGYTVKTFLRASIGSCPIINMEV